MQSQYNRGKEEEDWKVLHEDLWARILNDKSFTTVERQRLSLVCKGWSGIINNVNLLPAHITLQLGGKEHENSCLSLFTERTKLHRSLFSVFILDANEENTTTSCLLHLILGSASSLQIQKLDVTNIHGPWLSILPAYTQLRVLSIRFPRQEQDDNYAQLEALSKQTCLISKLQELRLLAFEFVEPIQYLKYVESCNRILQALLDGPIECLQMEPTPDETAVQFWSSLDQLSRLRALALTHYNVPITEEEDLGKLPALRHLQVSYWLIVDKLAPAFMNLEILGLNNEDSEQEDGSYSYMKLVVGVLLKLPALRIVYLSGGTTEIYDMSKLWQMMQPNRIISFRSTVEDREFPNRFHN